MKTRFALLITMALVVVGLPFPAQAVSPFEFTVSEGNATIISHTGPTPTKLVIPDEVANGDGTYPVTAIANWAFDDSSLTELTLPDTLVTLGEFAFAGNRLAAVALPDTLTTIDGYAFHNNRLTEIDLPDDVTTIGRAAFYGNRLTELALPNALTTVGSYAFAKNELSDLALPNALITLEEHAFSDNLLTEVALPETLVNIGFNAFADNQLTSVLLGSAVRSIGNTAFGSEVATVRFTGRAPQIGNEVFGSRDPSVRFPWKFGAPRATGGYTTPTWKGYRTIPVADVTFTGGGDIDAQSLDVDGTTTPVKPTDPVKAGHMFSGWFAPATTTPFDFTKPITGDIALTAGFQVVTPVLTGAATAAVKLGDAFTWTPTTLTGNPAPTVTATGLPDGLTIDAATGVITGTVTDPALAGDHDVTITATNGIDPNGTFALTISVEGFTYSIADGAATITGYHGTAPTELVIPAQITDGGTYPVTAIGNNAFHDNQLTELDLPNALTTIGNNAFSDNQLTELTLPETVTTIGYFAFHDNQLTELTLPSTLTTIGIFAFATNQLTELTLPSTLTTIGDYAFAVNQLPEVALPGALTTIGTWAFAGNKLTELDLPNTLTTIGDYAFYDNQLTELSVPASVTSIGALAFDANSELDDVRFAGTAPDIGSDSLGTSDPTVRFPWKFGDPRATDGYTTPTWKGYETIAVADVTFTGGGDIATQSLDVDGTTTAVKPADPVKAGHDFTGWFAGAATTPFDFTTLVTGDVALTAGFEALDVPDVPADPAIAGLAPAITGNAREGKTLTARPGTLSPTNATVTYQWRANGKTIKGATKPSLKLRKAQAGKRITVTITAKSAGAPSVSKTSAKSKIVSSAKRRIVVSTRTVGKNKPVIVTATGFKPRQRITIWLGKDKRYTGRADSRGIITKTVKFAKGTKTGTHRIRVTGQTKDGRNQTVQTTVRYR